MLHHRVLRYVRSNLIAYLALFLALGGSAMAAKPLITGTDIQDESITGADVHDGSLTGADIAASTLGTVPAAARADDAQKLGGQPAASYLHTIRSENLIRDYGPIAPGTCLVDGFEDNADPDNSSVLVHAVGFVDQPLVFTGDSVGLFAGEVRNAMFRVCNVGNDPVDPPQLTIKVRIVP
jgi:hypothetical protein